VITTYGAVLAVCAASLALGQAAIVLCGARRWSWLAPAVGLALLSAICWTTVRLPGGGATAAVLVLVLGVAAIALLIGRTDGLGRAARQGLPVAAIALAAASLPFAVEGHFGILGTSLNPDMSQHLLAADRLAEGVNSQLLHDGYPLGPHAVAVALHEGLGIGLVPAFSGFTVAVAVLAALTALNLFADQHSVRRTVGALLVGLPYLVASYFAQGAFKETTQALLVLAFALALREASNRRDLSGMPLRYVPAAVLAIGSVYVYSFPGLVWPAGTAVVAAAANWAWGRRGRATAGAGALGASSLALIVFLVGALPELGRMIDFQGFETFNPRGPGLGNLFGQLSPFTALGIWPSGDFRVAPGDGAAPAAAFYLGAAFATAVLLYGLLRCWRRREGAILAALMVAAVVYAAARIGGTPYTAAKALEIAAPLATAVIALGLLPERAAERDRVRSGEGAALSGRRGGRSGPVTAAAAFVYVLAAGGCSLLAFANAPVGPASYSPALAEFRPLVRNGSTLVLASSTLLDEQQGTPFLAWELRGGRVCIKSEAEAGAEPPPGVRYVIASEASRAPFPGFQMRRSRAPFVLWETRHVIRGKSPCPPVEVRQARQGPHP
jgi:hypothetical protein